MTASTNKKRPVKRAFVAGIVLGLVCFFLPPEFQTACEIVSKVFLTCGAPGAGGM